MARRAAIGEAVHPRGATNMKGANLVAGALMA
jgi:hypothetical protein